MTNEPMQKSNLSEIKPSVLAAICFLGILIAVVFLFALAIAWNGGYWKGRDTGFTDMWNATHTQNITAKHIEGQTGAVDNFGAKVPPGWEPIPDRRGE